MIVKVAFTLSTLRYLLSEAETIAAKVSKSFAECNDVHHPEDVAVHITMYPPSIDNVTTAIGHLYGVSATHTRISVLDHSDD